MGKIGIIGRKTGVIGGIVGLLAAVFALAVGSISYILEALDANNVLYIGAAAMIISIIGIIGGSITKINNKAAGILMLIAGVMGFVLQIEIFILGDNIFILATRIYGSVVFSAFWIVSAILLLIGGFLTLKTK